MGDAEIIGGLIAATITVAGSWLVARASAKSSQRSAATAVAGQIESSRIQAEEGAFERAKAFYEGVIDRQDAELDEQQTEIRDLKGGMAALNKRLTDQDGRLADCRKTCRALARRLGDDPDAADF